MYQAQTPLRGASMQIAYNNIIITVENDARPHRPQIIGVLYLYLVRVFVCVLILLLLSSSLSNMRVQVF